jgi:predicted enzyme related to lactoylglutathione lyase
MQNNHINYVEFRASDLPATKTFFSNCFGWTFTDYGPDYVAFDSSGLQGGFEKSDLPPAKGALVILYHDQLEQIEAIVVKNGGKIVVPIFDFPGGRRFHFEDPNGNEWAIWSNK